MVAEVGEQFHHRAAHLLVILDHQNGFASADHGAALRLRHHILILAHPGQVDAYRGTVAGLAVDFDMAFGLLDETIHHAEPEPGALPLRLGAEKRLEHLLDHLRGHAAAGIRHRHHDVLPWRHIAVAQAVFLIQQGVAGLDGELAMALHGIARIDGEVE